MHADSSAARLGWPGRRAKASAGRRTVFPKCGATFQGAFEGGRTKIERGRTRIEGGAQASKGGAAPRYVALASSLVGHEQDQSRFACVTGLRTEWSA